jgi:hypothetical protein
VILNPFRNLRLITSGTDAVAVDDGDHVWSLPRFAYAMRAVSGHGGIATTVPVAGTQTVSGAGSVVLWDRQKALALFEALEQDRSVKNLVG